MPKCVCCSTACYSRALPSERRRLTFLPAKQRREFASLVERSKRAVASEGRQVTPVLEQVN